MAERKKAAKKKGYKMPPPIPPGEVLTDAQAKKKWRIGPSIGVGGFGEIYSASDEDVSAPKSSTENPYVVKIEPSENGPLFVEKHFYSRNANKDDKISDWREEHCLKLIEVYKEYRSLWDPFHADHKIVSKRRDAWNKIAEELNADVNVCKRKISTLMSTYRKINVKVKRDEDYSPTWFAYKHLDFLSSRYPDCPAEEQEQEQTLDAEEEKQPSAEKSSEDESSRSSEQSEPTASHDTDQPGSGDERLSVKRKLSQDEETNKMLKADGDQDEYDVYGQYIAHVLRGLDSYSMNCVQKVFSDVIFHARTGKYLEMAKQQMQNFCNMQPDAGDVQTACMDVSAEVVVPIDTCN